MKKQSILNLIKYYAESNDIAFRNEAYDIAKQFNEAGDSQLANYIVTTLAGPTASLSAQNFNDDYDYFKKIPLTLSSTYLPMPILNDIKGLMNAIKNNTGINKFLFVGKPGTGKTETAKFVARQLKRELLSVDFNSIIDSKLGQSGKNISEMFRILNILAKTKRYVFLFDEIDVIAFDRVNKNDLREMGRVTSLFLKELDEVDSNATIIATTNLFKNFDKALTRRFDAVISFDRYEKDDIKEISTNLFKEYANKFNIQLENIRIAEKLIDGSDVYLTPGELRNIIKVNLAFSDTKKPNDYLVRLFAVFYPNKDINDVNFLHSLKLTYREIEFLTNISKSQVSRLVKEETCNE